MTEATDDTTTVESTEHQLSEDVEQAVGDLPTLDAADDRQGDAAEPEMFPREVVEELRRENGKYRQRAQRADNLAERLHLELVRATGRLADPTDLEFDEAHIDDADALTDAIDELLTRKPHLATRRPSGDIGQGQRGSVAQPFSLLQMLKERT
jgi:hypothetical protein